MNPDKLIIANTSGFYGDRFSGMREMLDGGPVDVLTGEYLAELTMAILFRLKRKDPRRGYAPTFIKQVEDVLGECLERGVRIVSNAGGLNPRGLADALAEMAAGLGLQPKIACIEGDDLIGRLDELQAAGEAFTHMDRGIPLSAVNLPTISANAYLGGFGIAEALGQGADIVVTGRVADAALVVGPAAWHFGWARDDWDRLAGAAVAGHIIECSGQATGGNYAFIDEVPSFERVGFPLVEMHADGSFVVSKHPGTGGLVSVGTVTAQLLYEIAAPRYLTPDVVARFDTARVSQQGPDRVLVAGVRGEPVTDTTKVTVNRLSGHRNTMTIVLSGLEIEKKAQIVVQTLFDSFGGREQFADVDVQLFRSDKPDPANNAEACALLRVAVFDPDEQKAGRQFASKVVELALMNIPGFNLTHPPGNGSPVIMHWPALVATRHIQQQVYIGDEQLTVESYQPGGERIEVTPPQIELPPVPGGPVRAVPFGQAFGTRSGDKGGNANLGVWAKTPAAFAFLREFLTTEQLKVLLPDMAEFEIDRYELPNLLALNFYIRGVLGDGVAASLRFDPQAKTLGEYLRARVVALPVVIL